MKKGDKVRVIKDIYPPGIVYKATVKKGEMGHTVSKLRAANPLWIVKFPRLGTSIFINEDSLEVISPGPTTIISCPPLNWVSDLLLNSPLVTQEESDMVSPTWASATQADILQDLEELEKSFAKKIEKEKENKLLFWQAIGPNYMTCLIPLLTIGVPHGQHLRWADREKIKVEYEPRFLSGYDFSFARSETKWN